MQWTSLTVMHMARLNHIVERVSSEFVVERLFSIWRFRVRFTEGGLEFVVEWVSSIMEVVGARIYPHLQTHSLLLGTI